MSDLSGVSPPTPPTETMRSLLEEIVAYKAFAGRDLAIRALAILDDLRAKRSNLPVAFAVQLIDPDPVGRPETGNNT